MLGVISMSTGPRERLLQYAIAHLISGGTMLAHRGGAFDISWNIEISHIYL